MSDDTVAAFVDGRLAGDEANRVDEHIDHCETCRRLVGALGRAASSAGPFVADTVMETTHLTPEASGPGPARLEPGAGVGRYIILDVLGQGGMGVVYGAYDGKLDRKVALKQLRAELADEAARTRLLREARAVARLAHPNVVTVHDVESHGATLFVAMEYVDGQPLTEWLKAEPRPWRAVLETFLQAGRGLVASHAAGLVHRDFKPANVLVGKDGRVRVTDFGVARLVDRLRESAPDTPAPDPGSLTVTLTQTGSLVGTPAYMAPEQFEGASVDAGADQFSFAVSLYEGLYGERPFPGRTVAELREQVRAGRVAEPPAGSRVPAWLRKAVLVGLSPRPDGRYPSMSAFLAELSKDPGRTRRRLLLGAGGMALLILALVGGRAVTGGSGQLCKGAERRLAGVWDDERKQAVRAAFLATGKPYAADAWATAEKLLDGYSRAWVAMHTDTCEATQVRGEQSAEHESLRMVCLGERLAELRALVGILAHADADVTANVARSVLGLTPLDGCADVKALASQERPPRDPAARARIEEIDEQLRQAIALNDAGRYDQGALIAIGAVEAARLLGYRPLEARARRTLGGLHARLGDDKAAEKDFQEAIWAAEAGHDDWTAADAWIWLVRTVGVRGARADEALRIAQYAQAAIDRLGGNDRLAADLADFRALVLEEQGKYAEALAEGQRAQAIASRQPDPDPLALANNHNNLGNIYFELGQNDKALAEHQAALSAREQVLGKHHPEVAQSLNNLGNTLNHLGRYRDSEAAYRRALVIREATTGDTIELAELLNNLGDVLRIQRHFDEAEAQSRRALAIKLKTYGHDHPSMADGYTSLGNILYEADKLDAAQAAFEESLAINEKVRPADHPRLAAALAGLAGVKAARAQYEPALALMKRALEIDEKRLGPDHPSLGTDYSLLGAIYHHQGKYDDALAAYRRALAIGEKALGPDAADLAVTLSNIGDVLVTQQKFKEAREVETRALAVDEKALGPDHPDLIYDLYGIGEASRQLGEHEQAIPPLERALGLRDVEAVHGDLLAKVELSLGTALWETRRDRARARRLVEGALAKFQKLGSAKDVSLARSWLARH